MKKIFPVLTLILGFVFYSGMLVVVTDYFDEPEYWKYIENIVVEDRVELELGTPTNFSFTTSGIDEDLNKSIFQRSWTHRHPLTEHQLTLTTVSEDEVIDYRTSYRLRYWLGNYSFTKDEGRIEFDNIQPVAGGDATR